jgi:superkiller protein 3
VFNAELNLSSTRKSVAKLIPFLLVLVIPVFSQSDLRKAVYGKSKSAEKTSASKSKINKKVINKAKSTAAVAHKNTVLIPVTFTGKEESVEIFLNDKTIGLTDSNFQFSKKIAPGEYRLMAKNKRQVLISKKINISPEQTQFELFEKSAPVVQSVQPQVVAEKPKEKTAEEIGKETGEKVKKILETYESPATTDSVTPEEWQFVLQNFQNGQYIGLTAVQMDAQRWFASGQIERSKNEFANALTAFQKSAEFLQTWAFPYYELGNTYLANNQPLDAVRHYQKALQINNKLGMAYKKLGDAQRILEKEKEALAAYEAALQFGYRTYETKFQTAVLRIENKQIEKGIAEFEVLVKENPNADIYFRLGEAYERLKRPLPAIDNYQKAISLDPNATQAHYRIGGMFMSQREYTKAKESLEKAITLDPAGKVVDIKEAQKKLREIATKSNK